LAGLGKQAVLRGGLLHLGLPSSSSVGRAESTMPSAWAGVGHITPEWELHSNLRLLCGNHHGMKQLKENISKNMVFTGY
jgi:hypothetical protein